MTQNTEILERLITSIFRRMRSLCDKIKKKYSKKIIKVNSRTNITFKTPRKTYIIQGKKVKIYRNDGTLIKMVSGITKIEFDVNGGFLKKIF